MVKKDYFIIGLLASAVILLTLLFVFESGKPQIVYAGSMQGRGGDYIATISRASATEEVLWVLDCRNKTAGIYQYDPGSRTVELRAVLRVRELGE